MDFPFLLSKYGLLVIALVGMLSHFLKKQVKGESVHSILEYFKAHFKTTFLSLIATWIGWIGYVMLLTTGQTADIFAAFAVGYMCDSVFNKYETKQ